MNILSELKNELRQIILPLLGQEVPLAISEVIEAIWAEEKRPQLHSRKKTALGYDFYYELPAGISFRDFAARREYFRDAIGLHSTVDIIHSGKMALVRVVTQRLKSRYEYDWDYPKHGVLPIPIGYTHQELIVVDLADIPHLLIGGITGGGKSNAIHVIVNSLIHLPVRPEIILIDLKMSEYNYLENHAFLVTDHEGAARTLQRLVAEMRRRQRLLKDAKCVNIAKYNAKHGPLPYVVLVIDELAELNDENSQDDVETLLRLSRSSGICIIAATQRPDANTFKRFGQSKANFRGRLCFQVADSINSKIILDSVHAADLPDTPGRALWRLGKELVEVQTPYLDPEAAERRLTGE
ncbi:MAG: FtsK/SpoIIIE domain-containing protein [Negativicutes bacterium]|nr:FtsK/SpoIIIE domain-containing protein [Negativicutes bacterium]